ncbi:hypothetical protein [Listeria sp. ILCC797]|uniref:hypothetical protein n=1 Tax=Listeria sp. ILCC797 TaxID=1918333 RepID=UPI000B596769|nr:hypothetical protein [Listeria sp. ILCC797]
MQLITVDEQENWDTLMHELEVKGYKWKSGKLPTERDIDGKLEDNSVILVNDDKRIFSSDRAFFKKYYPVTEIIDYKTSKFKVVDHAKYYNFPEAEYYALIKAENEEAAKKIYVEFVGCDHIEQVGAALEISELEAKKQWNDADKYWNEVRGETDMMPRDIVFEDFETNSLMLIDASLL